MAKFRKVEFIMVRGNGYGQYKVIAENYKGKRVVAHTTDSQVWDWYNDEGNTKEERELHQQALRHCYYKIVAEYEKMK